MFRIILAAAFAGLLAYAGPASADEASRYGKQKVVYHINYTGGPESKAYKGAMRNIHVFSADGVDVVLDIAHCAAVFLVTVAAVVIDVVDDLLLPVTLARACAADE